MFNQDFISESVFPVGGGDVPPIFVLGRENVEKEKALALLKSNLATTKESLLDKRRKKDEYSGSLDKHCRNHAKTIKTLLRGAWQE